MAKVKTPKTVLESVESRIKILDRNFARGNYDGSYFSNSDRANLKKTLRVLKLAADKIKELEKKTGYSTSLVASTCNNCGHYDRD